MPRRSPTCLADLAWCSLWRASRGAAVHKGFGDVGDHDPGMRRAIGDAVHFVVKRQPFLLAARGGCKNDGASVADCRHVFRIRLRDRHERRLPPRGCQTCFAPVFALRRNAANTRGKCFGSRERQLAKLRNSPRREIGSSDDEARLGCARATQGVSSFVGERIGTDAECPRAAARCQGAWILDADRRQRKAR